MAVIRVLLIEDDDDEVARFMECAAHFEGIEIIACTKNAFEGIAMTKRDCPDGVILDLQLKESHGIWYMEALDNGEFLPQPAVVVITSNRGVRTLARVNQHGSECIFDKNEKGYSPDLVLSYLKAIIPNLDEDRDGLLSPPKPVPATAPLTDEEIWERIKYSLHKAGCSDTSRYLCYLTDIIFIIASRNAKTLNLQREAYRPLAEKYGVTVKAIHNGAAYCMQIIWDSIRDEPDAKKLARNNSTEPPELKSFLLFLAKKYTFLWKGRS